MATSSSAKPLLFVMTTLYLLLGPTTAASTESLRRSLAYSCKIADLAEACPDKNVDQSRLVSHCESPDEHLHGLHAAECYMEFLCMDGHPQSTVESHKDCIDSVCPLARHLGTIDCQTDTFTGAHQESSPSKSATQTSTGGFFGVIETVFLVLACASVVLVAAWYIHFKRQLARELQENRDRVLAAEKAEELQLQASRDKSEREEIYNADNSEKDNGDDVAELT